jgi:hypothetical protein
MNGAAHMTSADFPAGMSPVLGHPIQSDLPPPVFSPAVRFAPKELSLSQLIRLVVYWVTVIAITLVIARSGFSYLRQISSERSVYPPIQEEQAI